MYSKPIPESFDKYDEPRLHMEALMSVKLVEFDLPLRILIVLEAGGVRTLGDLCSKTRDDLLKIRRFGVAALRLVEKFLAEQDLYLGYKY